ncbi:hypothetical protein F5X98DRAFT_386103 [Xylaria grammica]|nr:hypothetical protein F5X98DRAFT_386103 [Xylaria grammica]
MSILRPGISLKEGLEATDAIQHLEKGRLDRFLLSEVQAVVNDFSRVRGLEQQEWQEIDRFLGEKLKQFKYQLYTHEAAIVACCHAMSHDGVREQLVSIRPAGELPQHIQLKSKAWVQCVFHCQRSKSDLLNKVERTAVVQLLHAVVPARSNSLQPIWKLLRAAVDERAQESLPIEFIGRALVYCDYFSKLTHELETFQSSRRWSEALTPDATARLQMGSGERDASCGRQPPSTRTTPPKAERLRHVGILEPRREIDRQTEFWGDVRLSTSIGHHIRPRGTRQYWRPTWYPQRNMPIS